MHSLDRHCPWHRVRGAGCLCCDIVGAHPTAVASMEEGACRACVDLRRAALPQTASPPAPVLTAESSGTCRRTPRAPHPRQALCPAPVFGNNGPPMHVLWCGWCGVVRVVRAHSAVLAVRVHQPVSPPTPVDLTN